MIAKASILHNKVILEDNDDYYLSYFSTEEARKLAHELLCAAEKVDGGSCIVACFTRQGDNLSKTLTENICKRVTELVDEHGEIDGVILFPGKVKA